MQSQTATIEEFNYLLQEIQPKVQVFRNKIVNSQSNFLDFFKNFLKLEEIDFFENDSSIVINLNVSKPDKPHVALKFSISEVQTKNDDIANLSTIIGIISFVKNNPTLLAGNLIIVIEKLASGSEFLYENDPDHRIALVVALDNNPLVESDSIALKKGTLIPAQYDFRIGISSALASDPKSVSSVDVIALAAQAITSLSQIPTRKIDPLHLTHVSFNDINTTRKQFRQGVEITGVIKALNETAWIRMKSIMESTLAAITKPNDCSYNFSLKSTEQIFQNDAEYSQFLFKRSKEVLGKTKVQSLEHLNKNFDRCSSFFRKFPTVILHVGGLDSSNGRNPISTLQLREIDQISTTTIKAICWMILKF